MADLVVLIIVVAIVILSICNIIKNKKNGRACMNCPSADCCNKSKKEKCSDKLTR